MLDATPDAYDHEQRHLVDARQARELFQALSKHCGAGLRERGDFLRTTYFDTADGAYARSCDGPVRRRLRVREYTVLEEDGTARLNGRCALELKESHGAHRTKQRWLGSGEEIRRALAGQQASVPPALAAFFPAAQPVVTTWYRRQSMMSPDATVRVTLDHELLLAAPEPVGEAGALAYPSSVLHRLEEGVVLELKWRGGPPEWLAPALATLGPPSDAFSKFTYAVRTLGPLTR